MGKIFEEHGAEKNKKCLERTKELYNLCLLTANTVACNSFKVQFQKCLWDFPKTNQMATFCIHDTHKKASREMNKVITPSYS